MPLATFAFRRQDLLHLAYLRGALYFSVYLGWALLLFRREKTFPAGMAYLKTAVLAVCLPAFAAYYSLLRDWDIDPSREAAPGRVVAFSLYCLAFLRLFHWHFLKDLRRKWGSTNCSGFVTFRTEQAIETHDAGDSGASQ